MERRTSCFVPFLVCLGVRLAPLPLCAGRAFIGATWGVLLLSMRVWVWSPAGVTKAVTLTLEHVLFL